MCCGHGDDTDLNVTLGDDLRKIGNVLHATLSDARADDDGIRVENRGKPEAEARDSLIVCKRCTEVSHADDSNIPMIVESQYAADALFQLRDIVADALLAKLSEERQIFTNLFGVDGKAAAELLRGGDLHALVRQLTQTAIVARQPVDGRLGYR